MPKHDGEDELYDELIDVFHEHMESIDLDELELAVEDHDLQSIERAVDLDGASHALIAVLAAALLAAFVRAGRIQAEQSRIDFNTLEATYLSWLQGRVVETAMGVTRHAYDTLRNVFLRGVRGGLSPREIARQIRFALFLTDRDAGAVDRAVAAMVSTSTPVSTIRAKLLAMFGAYLADRARVIASTELTAALGQAVLLVQREAERNTFEFGSRKRWVTALDEMVCPVCRPLHNVTVDLNGLFPGGLDSPPAHPRCRCHVEIVQRSHRANR